MKPLDQKTWSLMKEQAIILVKSKMIPSSIDTVEKAIAIMIKGHELGLPPMVSFSHIVPIKGRPTISPELMMALIYKNLPGSVINFKRLETDGCEIEAKRPGGEFVRIKFDKEDAKSAGLLEKENWRSYPRAMMRSRAIAECARSVFPDIILGCGHSAEELDPDIRLDEEGNISQTSQNGISSVIYDNSNKLHKDNLIKYLVKKEIPERLHEEICISVNGKSKQEIEERINGVLT